MTRKKSNVKALALAVTCAILAGGYSGLNPVYAAEGLYKDSATNYITTDSSGATGDPATASKWKLTVIDSGLKIGGIDLGLTNSGAITIGSNTITETDIGNWKSVYSTVGNNTTTGTLAYKTQKITYETTTGTTVDGVTLNNGAITASSLSLDTIGDVTTAINGKAAQADVESNRNNIDTLKTTVGDTNSGLVKKVADNEANIAKKADKTALEAANGKITTLEGKTTNLSADGKKLTNMEEVGAAKVSATTLKVGDKEITADTVAGYDAAVSKTANITYDATTNTTYINKDDDQQVVIDANGLKVGKNSSRMNDSDGFATSNNLYVGTADADNPTAANSKFYVKGADGSIKAADGKFTVDDKGNVVSKGSVTANQAGFNNLAVTNGLTVGSTTGPNVAIAGGGIIATNGTDKVTIGNGAIVATGNIEGKDITATGNLSVAGTSTFTGETTFSGGIKTNTINEVTADTGVTVDGVLLKDKGIEAADGKFTVNGANGNTTVGGTLGVTGAATLGSTLDVTGDTTLHGALNAKGKATFGNAPGALTEIDGDKLKTGVITTEQAQESNIGGVKMQNGKITASNMEITGAISLNDLTVNNKLTVGAFSVDNTGVVTGVKSINGANVTASGTGLTIGSATVGAANPFSSTGFTVDATGNITAGTYNGNTISTDNKFNGVELNGGNVAATKVTADTITDGTGFTATGGNVNAKDINATTATIAGVGFAANNVSDINNLTATGTIQGATLKVNDSNLLDSNGLTATKAVIDNLTIDGASITSNNADGSVGVAGITVDKTGAITGVKAIDGVAVAGNTASGLTIGSGATAVTIGGNSLALSSTGFNVDDDGDVTGKSFKVNGSNYLDSTGLTTGKAVIGGVNTLDGTGISTTGTLDVEGVAKFGKNDADQTKITQGKAEFTQGGKTTTITGGEIETDKLTVNDIVLKNSMKDGAGNTITIKGSDGSMSVASGKFAVDKEGQLTNKITGTASGFSYETNLETSKSGIKANYTNAINGNQNIIDMGASGISIGVVSGTTPSVGAGFKAELDAATMGYGTANSIVVNQDTIKSKLGTDVTRVMTNNTTEQSIVDKVGTAKRSLKADEIVDEVAGMTVKTNSDGTLLTNGTTTTLINGSAITSTKATGDTGVLNGSNLTLTNGANSTALTAGGATFTGDAGEKGGKVTTINGGTITTDTLNVDRINLGGEVIDKGAAGVEDKSKLYMDAKGNLRAAGGNFKVTGADGAMTNTVGKTTLQTNNAGASMSYAGTVTSNVSVGNNNANVSAGAGSIDVTNESITSKVTDNASSTITKDSIVDKVGGTTVETKDGSFSVKGNVGNGMHIDTNTGETTFTGAAGEKGGTTTTINGGNITTDTLNVERINLGGEVIDKGAAGVEDKSKLYMDAKGNLRAAGGNFKVTGADGAMTNTVGKTSFATSDDGVNSSVTQGAEHKSEFKQGLTSIGGVVTNGTVKIEQTLDGDNGNITNEVTDKDGKSSKLVQNGTGLEYTDSAKADNATRINSSDVSIGSATDDSKRINLSDLGQIDDLDSEIQSRDEYKNNQTAVGAINAEAGIRREEVARLDNRIDDVNNRVDKVGAMAAAIASLKSIGYDPQAPSEFSIGLGQYKGETGVAMGFFHYPNKNFMINVSLSTAGGETMGGIGATWRFGHKSPQKLLEEQREAQAKKELAAAEKYQAAAKLAKEAQERAEYAAKLARQAQVSADNAKAAADATQAKHFQ